MLLTRDKIVVSQKLKLIVRSRNQGMISVLRYPAQKKKPTHVFYT